MLRRLLSFLVPYLSYWLRLQRGLNTNVTSVLPVLQYLLPVLYIYIYIYTVSPSHPRALDPWANSMNRPNLNPLMEQRHTQSHDGETDRMGGIERIS